MNRFFIIIVALLNYLLPAAPRAVPCMLDHAVPKVGSTVAQSPREVVLWFTERLEPAFSSIEVRNEQGAAVNGARPRSSATTPSCGLPLKALSPGTYKVIWRVLSVDTPSHPGRFQHFALDHKHGERRTCRDC